MVGYHLDNKVVRYAVVELSVCHSLFHALQYVVKTGKIVLSHNAEPVAL